MYVFYIHNMVHVHVMYMYCVWTVYMCALLEVEGREEGAGETDSHNHRAHNDKHINPDLITEPQNKKNLAEYITYYRHV